MPEMVFDLKSFISIFIAGLALNLTPCVYPMLSITVALFGQSAEMSRWRAFARAFAYFLGIVCMYSALGVFAAMTGGFFGAWLQNAWVLIGVGIFILLIALSMFGLYTFQLPPALVSKAGALRQANWIGLFLSGLTVGIVAAPCIGPAIVGLLTYASTHATPQYAFLLFFTLALGLGFPYLLLGTFSHLLKRLPRSGVWLTWVERLFGVILVSLAIFYFLIALRPEWIPWLLPVMLIVGGVYLGFIEPSGGSSGLFPRFKKIIGCVAIGTSLTLIFSASSDHVAGVVWEKFSEEKLAAAQSSEQPIIVDVFAEWCLPCHELERITYADPAVIAALESFVRLKADITNPNDPVAAKVLKDYDIVGVPTILFFNARGQEVREARQTGFIGPVEMQELIRMVNDSEH